VTRAPARPRLGRLEKAKHYAESVAATAGAFVLFVAVRS
jgi:hypothetical protein